MKSRGEPQRKKAIFAWCLYDWANSVFAMAAIFGKTALGLDTGTLIGTLLLTQFVARPGANASVGAPRPTLWKYCVDKQEIRDSLYLLEGSL